MFSNNYHSATSSRHAVDPLSSNFPASGLHLPSPNIRTPQFRRQESDILHLQLHELLRNVHVLQLWNQSQSATEKLLEEAEEQKKLLQQINVLTAETHSLKAEIAEMRYRYNQSK
jgi:hypothetical protein